MKNSKYTILSVVSLMLLSSCSCSPARPGTSSESGSGSSGGTSESGSGNTSISEHTQNEVDAYMEKLKGESQSDHFYLHYVGFDASANYYNDWDVWAWPYRPKEGDGAKFDWVGRTQSSDRVTATGNAAVDEFGYCHVDIDLHGTYNGGWSSTAKTIGGSEVKFTDKDGNLDTQIGFQIVYSDARIHGSGFWKNDGGNNYVVLDDVALTNKDGTKSYHVFCTQDNVGSFTATPPAEKIVDPFENDNGTNVTYGNNTYSNADWTNKQLKATSPEFLSGSSTGHLQHGAGVGYQIMVASFADSDGDGFGDIYGIQQKLDYLANLGVNVLWLTPIQLSDSYHGYDIADYLTVDPKFGSAVSPAGVANGGKVTSDTALLDYKALLDAAHEKHMAVVMDLVLNHTSTTNTWFINSAQLNAQYRGFYQWGNHDTQATQINENKYWYPYGNHVYSYYAKFGSSMPELNYAYVDTRTAVETMAKNWCQIGVDGFRMDAVKHIFLNDEVTASSSDAIILDVSDSGDYSSNLTKNLNFWRELNYAVKQDYPNAFFVGENFDGHAYHVAPYYEGFDSLFDFYSYFNLTSVASSAYRNGSTGAYTGWLASYLGAYDDTASPSSKYTAEADANLTGDRSTVKYGDVWSLKSVLRTNNKYRTGGESPSDATGYSAINGAFTSNHDIARAINRIAGQVWSASGLEAQGEVTNDNFADLDSLATLVEITELMLPGCTWIYYGDELGMTGNLGSKTSTSPYADLLYRQPMKWKQGGQIGDGSMTTGYSISGSGASVGWDNINASTKVADAETQVADANSHYSAIKAFATAKSTIPALIKGNFSVKAIEAGAQTGQYGVEITRTLGSEVYKFYVNFGNTELTVYDGNISKIGARTAVLTKGSQVIATFGGTVSGGGSGGGSMGEWTDTVTYTVNNMPTWITNDGCVIFAWVWGGDAGDGAWVALNYTTSTSATFEAPANITGMLLARCKAGTTIPSWSVKTDIPGRVYNQTNNITVSGGNTTYSAPNDIWKEYNPS